MKHTYTEQEQAQQSLQETTERLNILHKIDQAILKAESKEAIAKAAISYIPRIIDCLRSDVVLFDLENNTLTVLATRTEGGEGGTVAGSGWRMALEKVWRRLISRMSAGETVVVEDIATLDAADPFSVLLKDQGVRSLIRQPIRHSGELLGMLQVGRPQVGPVELKLLDLTQELGDQLAIALRQARFHEEIQDHAEAMEQRVAWRTAALRISEARFRAIFEDAPMGIALLDRQGRIIQHNGALQRTLAQEKSAIHEASLTTYMVDEDAAAERERYAALLRGNDKGYQADVRFEHPEHRVIWCTLTVAQIRDVEHQARLAISMVEDITERRKAQAALVQTEKLALTGQLAASLAHEINNPLQTVIGCLGLAQEDLGDRKSVEVYLEMASSELRRAADIVARLRDLNSPSNPEDKEPTRVSELVDRVKVITEKQMRDRNIHVHVVEASPLSPIPVVPDRIQQVFLNLVLNAIDAMPDGGELNISLAELNEPRGCRIAFEDTGVGIPPEVQIDLFSPFHTTKSEGLGLGLFISQSIIEEHGGSIEVESQAGEGTTFTIWLPA